MTPKFSQKSLDKLATCHPDLQRLFNEVIKGWDCIITCGHRSKQEQNQAYVDGFSKVQFPNSKHNSSPSLAVDVMACPVDYNDWKRMYMFAGYVLGVAAQMGIKVRSGIDFNQNRVMDDRFVDAPHWEIVT
jgi:hypothetical protein